MILPDTNVLIAYFAKSDLALSIVDNAIIHRKIIFSVITVAEFLIKADKQETSVFKEITNNIGITYIDYTILKEAIVFRRSTLRKTKRSHLLDCLIAATAKVHGAILVTYNRRDYLFPDLSAKQPEEIKV